MEYLHEGAADLEARAAIIFSMTEFARLVDLYAGPVDHLGPGG